MSSALKIALSFFAILGIFSGKAVRAFATGYQTQKNTTDLIEQIAKRPMIHDQVTFAALNIIGQQNQAMTGFMLQSYDLLMNSQAKKRSKMHGLKSKLALFHSLILS